MVEAAGTETVTSLTTLPNAIARAGEASAPNGRHGYGWFRTF